MFRPRSRATLIAVACLFSLVLPLRAQDAGGDKAALDLDSKIIADAQKTSEIMKNLGYLSDVIGPRLTGSANLKRANEWTAEVMKSYGLSNVHLEPWEIPIGWERGTATMKLIEPDNGRGLTVAAAGWSPGTKGKIVSDVVVLNARNKADLEKYRGKLKNAVILRGEPAKVAPVTDLSYGPGQPRGKRDPKDGEKGPDAKSDEKKAEEKKTDEKKTDEKKGEEPKGPDRFRGFNDPFQRDLAEFLRAEGAVVTLRDSGKPHNLLVTTGGWPRNTDRGNAPEPMPSLFIAHEHYALLYRLATRPAPAVTRVEVEITNKFIPGPITVYNTVGEIPGEKADEFVVVGAHLDSWDLAQGTTDNGTGSCIVLDTARLLVRSGVKPKRTIRFVLFTGEEQGLHGSRQYVTRHKDEMAKTSVALVHDTGTGKVQGFGLQGREAIKPIMDRELVSLKNVGGFSGVTLRGMGGTDHLSFEQAGVPGFACAQDMDEYRLTHHTQSDTFDKAKEPNLIQGAQVMAVTAMRVANLPDLLPRDRPKGAFGFGKRGMGEERKDEGKKDDPPTGEVSKELLAIAPRVVKP
ncbi:MAG TPA: M20/M25/M40 family metallo-hydrolase [Gemmataceae bacterium]|nr:M20/M25/M40 family metallo-hydrolase [Gemmataceae bacterium]